MKTKKKVLIIMSFIFILAVIISGCRSASDGDDVASVEKPTITMFITDRADAPMNNELAVIKEISERTNVNIELELAPSVNTADRFNLMMASGDLPDVIVYRVNDLFKYIRAFEPINDLLEKHGRNILKVINNENFIFITHNNNTLFNYINQ